MLFSNNVSQGSSFFLLSDKNDKKITKNKTNKNKSINPKAHQPYYTVLKAKQERKRRVMEIIYGKEAKAKTLKKRGRMFMNEI